LWARSSRPGGESRDFGLIFPEVRNFARGVLPNEGPTRTRRRFEMLEEVVIVADFMADLRRQQPSAGPVHSLCLGLGGRSIRRRDPLTRLQRPEEPQPPDVTVL